MDLAANKLEMAARFGATDAVDPKQGDPVAQIRDLTAGIGVDYAFEVIGVPKVVQQAYQATRRGGTLTVVGVGKLSEEIGFNALLLPLQGKTIKGSMYGNVNPRVDFPKLLELDRRGKLDLGGMVTTTYSIDQAPQAFADLEAGRKRSAPRPLIVSRIKASCATRAPRASWTATWPTVRKLGPQLPWRREGARSLGSSGRVDRRGFRRCAHPGAGLDGLREVRPRSRSGGRA